MYVPASNFISPTNSSGISSQRAGWREGREGSWARSPRRQEGGEKAQTGAMGRVGKQVLAQHARDSAAESVQKGSDGGGEGTPAPLVCFHPHCLYLTLGLRTC